ncbi:MAG: hypothetical protein ACI4PL_09190 [Faecousia sp.]
MELYAEILIHKMANLITPQEMSSIVSQIVEGECYRTLEKIRAILRDDTLSDQECFLKIEEMICALEEIGSNAGYRHDFG